MRPEIKDIPLRTLTSGTTYLLRVIRFKGKNDGPGAYIQAGLHGAELQGTAVIHYLAAHFKKHPPLNDVVLVPQANPYGRDLKIGEHTMGRNDPITGDNWNRQFVNLLDSGIDIKTHKTPDSFRQALHKECAAIRADGPHNFGRKLALILQQYALEAKCVLDLHADSVSIPYIYSPAYATAHAKLLDIPYIIETPCQFSPCFNQSCFYPWWVWGNTHEKEIPFISCTVELGDKEKIDLSAAETQANNILTLLRQQKIVTGDVRHENASFYTVTECKFIRLYAETSCLVEYVAPLGSICQKRDLIARVLLPHTIGSNNPNIQDICAVEKCIPLTYASSGNILEGQELLKYIAL